MTARIMTGPSARAFAKEANVKIFLGTEDGIDISVEGDTLICTLYEAVQVEHIKKISEKTEETKDFFCKNKIIIAPDFGEIPKKILTKYGFECKHE